jgi:hypothetical protein
MAGKVGHVAHVGHVGNGRRSLATLIGNLQQALQALFTQREQARGRRRNLLQRRLLLGLELLCKIEEQALLPALQDAEPLWAPAIVLGTREIELMRDLTQLAAQTSPANREISLAVLEGMAALHFGRIGELLAREGAHHMDWPRLEREVRGLLGRWHTEVQLDGEIEDEDRDPVGLAPR